MEYKLYYPYKSTRHDKKFMVLMRDGKWLHFGDSRYQHYTEGHLDEKRSCIMVKEIKLEIKNRYDYDTPGFWSYWYLWKYKTYDEAYKHIKRLIFDKLLK